jgi:SAM-dependent methyltransferase
MRRLGIRPPGTLIDIGCAGGFFLSEAFSAGWTVFGVDVSPWSREQVRSRFGFEVFESIEAASRRIGPPVNAITAFQVLEHMPDILSTLQSLQKALRPEGSLVIETWNRSSVTSRLMGGAWQQLSPPSVVHLFDPLSLENLLDRSGFRPARLRPMTKFLSAAWAAGLVASKARLGLLRTLAGAKLLRRIPIPYFLDDLAYLATTPRP